MYFIHIASHFLPLLHFFFRPSPTKTIALAIFILCFSNPYTHKSADVECEERKRGAEFSHVFPSFTPPTHPFSLPWLTVISFAAAAATVRQATNT
jgi:hypothetical protein